jgi:HPt (histidine-containing phosphotransfer) domain-containing protein
MNYKRINTDYLQSVSGGDKTIIIELVDLFREQISEITNEMRSLLSRGDLYTLGLLAHKAKSSVAIMGMADLASMLKTFELEGKEGKNKENFESYINRYEKESNEAVIELQDFISTM